MLFRRIFLYLFDLSSDDDLTGDSRSIVNQKRYLESYAELHGWLVDEEAAAVVRRIFRLAVEGHGPYDISKILTADKVESPSYYAATRGRGSFQGRIDTTRSHDWYGSR